MVKILDFRGREEELKAHENPFALFVLAQLWATQTRKDPEERARRKLELIVCLRNKEMEEAERRPWYRYLDWLLVLPREYDQSVADEVRRMEQEKTVPFITFPERMGREQGYLKGLEVALELKFGAAGLALMPRMRQVHDHERLSQLLDKVRTATLEEVTALLDAPVPPPAPLDE